MWTIEKDKMEGSERRPHFWTGRLCKKVFLEGQVGRVCPPLNHRFPERNPESHQTLMTMYLWEVQGHETARYPQRIQDFIIAVPSSKPPQSGVTLDTAQVKSIS